MFELGRGQSSVEQRHGDRHGQAVVGRFAIGGFELGRVGCALDGDRRHGDFHPGNRRPGDLRVQAYGDLVGRLQFKLHGELLEAGALNHRRTAGLQCVGRVTALCRPVFAQPV